MSMTWSKTDNVLPTVTTLVSVLVEAIVFVDVLVWDWVLVRVETRRLSLYPEYDSPAPRTASTTASMTSRLPIFIAESLQMSALIERITLVMLTRSEDVLPSSVLLAGCQA